MKKPAVSPKNVRLLGIILLILSFIVPLPSFSGLNVGYNVFAGAVCIFSDIVTRDLSTREFIGRLAVGAALLANLSVFVKFRRSLLWVGVLAPWSIALF